MKKCINLRETQLQDGNVFIIAEVGNQFNGDVETARKLIDAAKDAGADAVKFIFWFPDEIMADKAQMYSYETAEGIKRKPNGRPCDNAFTAVFTSCEFRMALMNRQAGGGRPQGGPSELLSDTV